MITDVSISASQMTYIAERIRAAEDATKEAAKLNPNSTKMRRVRCREDFNLIKSEVMNEDLQKGQALARQLVEDGSPCLIYDGMIIGMLYNYKLNLIIAVNFLDEDTFERYKEYKKITGNMITLTIKHESNRRNDITERTFTTVRETRNYINAVVENMNKTKKWILRKRDAHSEQWVSIKGRTLMSFTY